MTDPVSVWWNRVPAAEQKVRQARNALLDGKSIQVSPQMVWLDDFIDLLIEKVKNKESGISYNRIDCSAIEKPEMLLDSLVREFRLEHNYDGSLRSLLPALEDSPGLIWHLRNLSPSCISQAFQLAKDARACSKRKICLLIEGESSTNSNAVESIVLAPSHLDIQYFIWTLLLEGKKEVPVEYASVCASELCNGDPHYCVEFYEDIDHALVSPGDVCYWMEEQELEHAMFIAQVKCIEPKIEMGRLNLVELLKERLELLLPFEDEFRNKLTRPYEVELRHLWHIKNTTNTLDLSADEARILSLLYNARNSLAHLKPLSNNTVNDILALDSSFSTQ